MSILCLILAASAILSCGGRVQTGGIANDTPTEAYKRLYAAVKAKQTDTIREQMSRKTIEWGESTAKQFGKSVDQHFANGFTATTFSETLPTIRDERIKDNMAAVEVWNSRGSVWEDLPFIMEDGRWKLAIGEQWAGTFRSPGPGRDMIEKQASNKQAGVNTNANSAAANGPKTPAK